MTIRDIAASTWSQLRARWSRSPQAPLGYKAFISYKHSVAPNFAAQLEAAMKGYAKPRLARPMRIFRDETHLVPAPDLPNLIASALDASEFFVLLASPAAAASPWVRDELHRWCGVLGRADNMIVVLVEGRIEVHSETKAIDWTLTDALPEMLRDYLPHVPLYVDLRDVATKDALTLEEPTFKTAVNSIVARLRGVDPNEMLGEEIQQHRRNLRLRNAALASLLSLTGISAATAYVAVQQASEAERQRNSALSRESQLLAAESIRSASSGRHAEALELALQALPNYANDDPRPYRPEAESALIRAVLGSPLRHHSPRPQGDLAAMFVDETADSVLSLTYSGELLLAAPDQALRKSMSVSAITEYQQEVDCRAITLRVLSCMRYHGGRMSGGCDKQVYSGHRQLGLLQRCLAIKSNEFASVFLQFGARADEETLGSYMEQFGEAKILNTSVTVRLDAQEIKRRVVPNFGAKMVALHSVDRKAVDVADFSSGTTRTVARREQQLVGMAWLTRQRLVVAFEDSIELIDVDSPAQIVASIRAHSIFPQPIALADDDSWVGISMSGQPIRYSASEGRIRAEGEASRQPVSAEALHEGSGFSWVTVAEDGAGRKRSSSKQEVSRALRVNVRNASDGTSAQVAESFAEVVSISALDAERLAIVADGRITVADRRSGEVVGTIPLPLTNVVGAWLMSVGQFYRTPIPEFFGETATDDPQFLLLTEESAAENGRAYIFKAGSKDLRQLDLGGARVEDVRVSPTTIILLADDRLQDDGSTHIFAVPRRKDPEVLALRGPPEVGGVFDAIGTDSSGLHLVLSENRKNVSVYSAAPVAPASHCADLPGEYRQFFHIEKISADRLIGVAERGLCFIDLHGRSQSLPTDFLIDEFVYSKRWQSVIAGRDAWGLHLYSEGAASPRQLDASTGTIDAIALSHDERFLFAIIDEALRAWSLPEGKLVFSSVPEWQPTHEKVSGIAISQLRTLVPKNCASLAVSRTGPHIAVGSSQGGLRLVRYDTGTVHDMAFDRGADSVAFSPEGSRLAVLEFDKLKLVNAHSGAVTLEMDGAGIEDLGRMEFDSSGKYLLAWPNSHIAQEHGNVAALWSLRGDGALRRITMPTDVEEARFSDDGETVLVGDEDGHVAIFDSRTGELVRSLEQHSYDADIASLPPGERLAVTGDSISNEFRIFHRASGIRLTRFEAEIGISVNNAFGRLERVVALPEWNTFLVATRNSGIIAVPFYFDPRDLRIAGEALASRD